MRDKKNKKSVSKKKKGKEQKIEEEKSKIEEEIKKVEKKIEEQSPEIENLEFEEFLQEPEFQRTSPSLRKINAPQRDFISLEKDLIGTRDFDKKVGNDSDPFKYGMTGANPEEPKYHNYEGEIGSNILRKTEIENLGRTDVLEKQEAGFMISPEAKAEAKNFEKYNPAEKFDVDKLGKENILEKREVKYKPSR